MRRVVRAPPPPAFEATVAAKGRAALLELTGDPAAPRRPGPKREPVASDAADIPASALPELWTAALPMLREAYQHTCAYLGFLIDEATATATVDHFVPKSADPRRAYDWDNFRLASSQMNTNKGEHQDVLDPFEVEDGWFALDLGTFEIRPNEELRDPELCARIQATIHRLKLNDPIYRRSRQKVYRRYRGIDTPTPWPIAYVREHAPYVAAELRRLGKLLPGDT